MSVLLIDPPQEIGTEVVTRLVREGDEVRVLERNAPRASLWTRLGAHVAKGDPADDDLVERAALNCRTVVTFTDDEARLSATARAAGAARVERMIAVVGRPQEIASEIDLIQLVTRSKGLRRKTMPPEALAAAIDAADDVAQLPRALLDLNEGDAWQALGLEGP